MSLTRYKLGNLLEISDIRNRDKNNIFGVEDVKGISVEKEFIETKANLKNVSLNPYKVVSPDWFAYVTVTSRNGERISIAHNKSDESYIVSSSYVVFKVKQSGLLDSNFLFMYFNRPEFDRFSRFNSWGSARETFTWEDLCDVEIELPSLEIQKKYAEVYKSLLANQEAYEEGLEDLRLVSESTIEKLKNTCEKRILGEFISETNLKNENNEIKKVLGVESSGNFMKTRANMKGVNLKNYSIVHRNDFAYNPSRINLGSIAKYEGEKPCIVSPMYVTFEVDSNKINPTYLNLWFSRSEFQRYTWYFSTGSVRDLFDINLMKEVIIPYPKMKVQDSIANIYTSYIERKAINKKLKDRIKAMCPILIKGALEEASREEV